MLLRETIAIPPLTGDRERRVFYYLPEGYDSGEERYPVLYMFDGHNLFCDEVATYGKCWGLMDYLDRTGTKIIVAAPECNHEGDMRLSEYSPVSFDFHGKRIVGRGKKYMDWLTGTFKPMVDGRFRTLPDRENTFIAGSSMGGLMTLYALAKYNGVFSKGAALSPSLWVQGGDMPSFIKSGRYGRDTVIFADYGTREFKKSFAAVKLFCETFSCLAAKGITVTARVVEGGTHCEAAWEREIPQFMCAFGL